MPNKPRSTRSQRRSPRHRASRDRGSRRRGSPWLPNRQRGPTRQRPGQPDTKRNPVRSSLRKNLHRKAPDLIEEARLRRDPSQHQTHQPGLEVRPILNERPRLLATSRAATGRLPGSGRGSSRRKPCPDLHPDRLEDAEWFVAFDSFADRAGVPGYWTQSLRPCASGRDSSFFSVLFSIWRMRSRVTPNALPTSSSVQGWEPSRP
jgi:hypothetical protein